MELAGFSIQELELIQLEIQARIKMLRIEARRKNVKIYCHDGNVWTGRGRRPKWIDQYVNDGGNLEDIIVHDGSKR